MKLKLNNKEYEGRFIHEDKYSLDCLASELAYNLELSQANGFRPVFMNELIDLRNKSKERKNLMNRVFITPSIKATGRTKQGKGVIIYAHTNNYLSNPENLRKIKSHEEGSAVVPIKEFHKLLDLDGITDENQNKLVWVMDYSTTRKKILQFYSKYKSKISNVNNVLNEHPEAIPFLCGEERAREYLKTLEEFGINFMKVFTGSEGEEIDKEKNYFPLRYEFFEENSVWRFLGIYEYSPFGEDLVEFLNSYQHIHSNITEFLAIRKKPNKEK